MNSLYINTFEKQRLFYENRPKLKKTLFFADKIATCLIAVLYIGVCFFVTFFRRESFQGSENDSAMVIVGMDIQDVFRLVIMPIACFLFVSLLRFLIDAKRPYERGITPLFEKKTAGHSFPSRHLTCAAYASFACIYYLLPVGILITFLEIVLFYARFTIGWHFPRDLIAGTLLGYLCAVIGFLIP